MSSDDLFIILSLSMSTNSFKRRTHKFSAPTGLHRDDPTFGCELILLYYCKFETVSVAAWRDNDLFG